LAFKSAGLEHAPNKVTSANTESILKELRIFIVATYNISRLSILLFICVNRIWQKSFLSTRLDLTLTSVLLSRA